MWLGELSKEMFVDAMKKIAMFVDKHFWIIVATVFALVENWPMMSLMIVMALYTKISEIRDSVNWQEDVQKRVYSATV